MTLTIGKPGIRVGNGLVVGSNAGVQLSGGGSSYIPEDADAATLIAAMSSTPNATRAELIDDTIIALKAAGIWDELDELWFMAAHTEQAGLLGWKRLKDLTAVNAPTFTADRGFAGNGTTSYLNTNYVPSTDGVQYTLNDVSFGVYSRTDSLIDAVDMGALGNTRSLLDVRRNSPNFMIAESNAGSFTNRVVGENLGTGLGLFVSRRTGSGATQGYHNGAQVDTGTQTSTAVTNISLFVGCRNNSGTPDEFCTRQYAFAFVGASLSAQQQADLYTHVQAYMTAVEANV